MSVHREAQRLETRSRFLCTVVIVGGAVGHHRNLVRVGSVGHRQRTIRTCDVVVGCKSAAVQRVSKGVGTAAHEGLRTRHVVGRALPTYEAARSDAHGAVGQRASIILLGTGGGGQGDLTLVNGQRAARVGKGVVAGVSAADRCCARCNSICSCVCSLTIQLNARE